MRKGVIDIANDKGNRGRSAEARDPNRPTHEETDPVTGEVTIEKDGLGPRAPKVRPEPEPETTEDGASEA